ncbi:peptide/nickel transport system substrate-binding protein [Stella humosa]|uniref:Peptide/nickel transport system substrate-binding protein n=1 Tax=Stella humosa TaxID=94 RepID=A0A3N1KV97_9PROT|nr:ABC transporter substrate-binding protein [Stella humosa]ROP83402.1 peptide/nickel transport system substrate-binding protein [Stella humosa]
MRRRFLLAAAATALVLAGAADAKTFRFSTSGDVNGLDPHLNNETPTNAMKHNLYEGLVYRNHKLEVEPALATEWSQTGPTTWRFKLRQGVTFHDGTPFKADDVIFSIARAGATTSAMRIFTQTIKEVRKVDDHTIDIETKVPDPILLSSLGYLWIMSKDWSEKNGTATPVQGIVGNESYANVHANGTGPFKVIDRVPDTRTVLVPFDKWWGKPEHNLTRVEFRPIANAATRVAALLSGELDMMYPVPLQDVPRLKRTGGVKVLEGPELRTIYIGMDQFRDELLDMPGSGKNPFKDRRVRQAFYQAIDVQAIHKVVMRGASTPTGLLIAPGINGFSKELNERFPFDPEGAKKLLADAGYPSGFTVTMDCSNDRYVNDEQICQAIAPMLARIGVTLKLNIQTKSKYFDKIGVRAGFNTSFFLHGWTPGTYDAHNGLMALVHTRDQAAGTGTTNNGRYSNAAVDALIAQIGIETDKEKRTRLIYDAMKLAKDDYSHIPVHQQALAWAVRDSVAFIPQPPDDSPMPRYIRMK